MTPGPDAGAAELTVFRVVPRNADAPDRPVDLLDLSVPVVFDLVPIPRAVTPAAAAPAVSSDVVVDSGVNVVAGGTVQKVEAADQIEVPANPVSRTRRRVVKFAFCGLALAGIGAGSLTFLHESKTVQLSIDGQLTDVHTSAADVKGALKSAGITVGPHDLLAPGLSAGVHGGSAIVVKRGHLLNLSIDGQARSVWVNAQSVDEALSQLGFTRNSFVSVSRSKRLDSDATSLAIYRPKSFTVIVGGQRDNIVSPGPTVRDALADAQITLGAHDRISVPVASTLTDGQTIKINRVRYGKASKTVAVPFDTVTKKDPSTYAGSTSVLTPGKDGLKKITYNVVYVDGKLSGRVVAGTDVITTPIDQVNGVGTKKLPAVVPAGTAQQIAAGLVAKRGWGNDQFSCLVQLWSKESGWRTNAANASGAYGIPQALPGSKMSSAGSDWETNPTTQITWGLNYIAGVYGTPCAAWAHSQASNWY